jgi:hypothetical protein
MKILIVGSSVNIIPQSWTEFFKQYSGYEIVNLSLVGVGNSFIHQNIILEVSQRSYDLVLPIWNNYKWVDFRNGYYEINPHYLHGNNSNKHFIRQDWMHYNTEITNPRINELKKTLFETHKHFHSESLLIETTLINIISTQSFLKANDIPYLHCFYRKFPMLKRFEKLNQLIDHSTVYPINLYNMARKNNWWDNSHPNNMANQKFAKDLYDYINTKNLIKS